MILTLKNWEEKLSPIGYRIQTIKDYHRKNRGDSDILEEIYQKKLKSNHKQKQREKEATCKRNLRKLEEESKKLCKDNEYGYGTFVSVFLLGDNPNPKNSKTLLDDLYTRDNGILAYSDKNLKLVFEDFMKCSFLNMFTIEKFYNLNSKQLEIDYAFGKDVLKISYWIHKYSLGKKVDAYNEVLYGEDYREKEARKSELKTIEKFKKIAINRVCIPSSCFRASSLLKGDKEPTNKYKEVCDFISIITKMEEDLKNKTSNVIPEHAYKKLEKATKRELKELLNNLTKKYDIKVTSTEITDFVTKVTDVKDMYPAQIHKSELTAFYAMYTQNFYDLNIMDFPDNTLNRL